MPLLTSFGRPFAQTVLLAFCWLLLVRASLFLYSGVASNPVALLLSDVAGAFLLAVLLSVVRGPRWRVLMVLILGGAMYAAAQHLAAHGTLFRLAHIGKAADPVFISGSVANPKLWLLPAYIALAWLLHRLHLSLAPEPLQRARPLLISAAVVLLMYFLAAPSLTTPANNVVASTLTQLPTTLLRQAKPAVDAEKAAPVDKRESDAAFFHHETAALEIERPPNVLLIMIEGLSGAYFPGVSEHHGLNPAVTLPALEDALKESGFRIYRNMLNVERQTDRGSYALLCGDYPRFEPQLKTKMAEIGEAADAQAPQCLPERLRKRGYLTAYWQAAPLGFMGKDAFMPHIGFETVQGARSFELADDADDAEGWGPTDDVYFAEVIERVRALDAEARTRPWFATLLNVGTHHPFDIGDAEPPEVPQRPSPSPAAAQEDRRMAMAVMEEALIGFLDQLGTDGILADTLVIITSDESGGFVRLEQEAGPLDGNAGVLAVRPPVTDSLSRFAERDRPVAQLDVPLTILDAAGLGAASADMTGRSLFVENPALERSLLLGDTYQGRTFFLRESGELLACTNLPARCGNWQFDPRRLFGSLRPSKREPFLTLEDRLRLLNYAAQIRPRENASE